MNELQKQINERFKEVYEALEKKGEIINYDQNGKNKTAFVLNIFGKDTTQYADWALGKKPRTIEISPLHIQQLYIHYNVNKEYMNSGNGPMFVDDKMPEEQSSELKAQPFKNGKEIKYYQEVAALASEAKSFVGSEEAIEGEIPGLEGNFYSFKVEGDSMFPTFEAGDLLLCRRLNENDNIRDNKIYVVNTTESVMVKRVQKIDSKNNQVKRYRLFSDNYLYHLPFETEEVRGFFEVLYRVGKVQ